MAVAPPLPQAGDTVPGLAADGLEPGQAGDADWLPFLTPAELAVAALITFAPVTWADLVDFCVELAELDALCKAGGIPWIEGPSEPTRAASGPGKARDGNRARGRPRGPESIQGPLLLVRDEDAGHGSEDQAAATVVAPVVELWSVVEDHDSSVTPLKRCGGPSHPRPVLLPFAEFGRDRTRADGLMAWCRACRAVIVRRRGEKLTAAPDGKRRCASCDQVKHEEEFGRCRGAPGGLRLKCKTCSEPAGWQARPADQRKASGYGQVKIRFVFSADYSHGTD